MNRPPRAKRLSTRRLSRWQTSVFAVLLLENSALWPVRGAPVAAMVGSTGSLLHCLLGAIAPTQAAALQRNRAPIRMSPVRRHFNKPRWLIIGAADAASRRSSSGENGGGEAVSASDRGGRICLPPKESGAVISADTVGGNSRCQKSDHFGFRRPRVLAWPSTRQVSRMTPPANPSTPTVTRKLSLRAEAVVKLR